MISVGFSIDFVIIPMRVFFISSEDLKTCAQLAKAYDMKKLRLLELL